MLSFHKFKRIDYTLISRTTTLNPPQSLFSNKGMSFAKSSSLRQVTKKIKPSPPLHLGRRDSSTQPGPPHTGNAGEMVLSHGHPRPVGSDWRLRKPEVGYPPAAIVSLFVSKISIPRQFFPHTSMNFSWQIKVIFNKEPEAVNLLPQKS